MKTTLIIIVVILVTLFPAFLVGSLDSAQALLLPIGVVLGGLIYYKPVFGLAGLIALIPLTDSLPPIPFVTSINVLIGAFTVLAFFSKALLANQLSRNQGRVLYLLVFGMTIMMLFGQLRSPNMSERNYFFTYLQLLILVWLCEQLLTGESEIRFLMIVYLLSCQLSVSVGLYTLYTSGALVSNSGLVRLEGLVGNANGMGIDLSVAIVMAYYFFRHSSSTFLHVFCLATIPLMFIAMILTGSRGAVLFFVPVILYQVLHGSVKGTIFTPAILILAALFFTVSFAPDNYLERIINIPKDILTASDTIGLRFRMWELAIQFWQSSPILGIGPGGYYQRTWESPWLLGRAAPAHNIYITFLAEDGIIGLGIFLAIVGVVFRYFYKAQRINGNASASFNSLVIAWQSALLILLLNGTKANGDEHKLMWLCFGVAAALFALRNKLQNEAV